MTGTRRVRSLLVLGVLTVGAVGLTPAAFAVDAPQAELRSPSTTFLANIDDDAGVCKARAKKIVDDAVPREKADDDRFYARKRELEELQKTDPVRAEKEYAELQRTYRLEQYQADRDLAACNDAADEVVNGVQDEADLARLRTTPWIGAPASATGRITVPDKQAQYVHVFIKRSTWELVRPDTTLSTDELRHGVELGIEGRDIVRDAAVWDGRITLNYTVTIAGISVTTGIQLEEAPIITQNNTQQVQNLLLSDQRDVSPDFDKAMVETAKGAAPLQRVNTGDDAWMQDMYEPAYTTMTGPDGKPHGMRVLITSVNNSRRVAARTAFTEFAGHDVAAVNIEHAFTAGEDESLDSMGNLETIPPTPGNPAGRIIIGTNPAKPIDGPAPEMLKFLRSQGTQNPLQLDTGWLSVGHVDEFIQFVPAPGSRLGWRAMIADPRQAVKMLSDAAAAGHSGQILHGNLPKLEWPYDLYIETRSIGEFLADQQFIKTNDTAAKKIGANITTLKQQAGLTEADIIRVPVLYTYKGLDYNLLKSQMDNTPDGPEKEKLREKLNSLTEAAAEIPNAVNGLVLNNGVYVAPKQYGPIINGKDIFAEAVSNAFQSSGLRTRYVDDLLDAHFSGGEVHCVTNTFRTFPG